MGVFVYTRHTADCPKRNDRFWRRCHCPKWIRGTLRGSEIRQTAETRSWERAEARARSIEEASHPQAPKPRPSVTIQEAVQAFLDDEQGRHLRKSTTGQSKTLLEKQLLAWAQDQSLEYLDELTPAVLARFRASWSKDLGNGQNTSRRKHERLCGFFHFCIRSEWTEKNPARLLKPIKSERVPTGYYTREEFARILDATYAYANWKGGRGQSRRVIGCTGMLN
jgi:integrase/recombinase XerD